MKTLLVLRHAKSSWKDGGLPDHDRPLNDRGKRDAARMGQLLHELALIPDLVVTSTARRARATAKAVARAAGFAGEIDERDDLYAADPETILHLTSAFPDAATRILLVGHNPGMEVFVSALAGEAVAMPTAALARLDFDVDAWRHLDTFGTARVLCRLRGHWLPKELDE